MKTNSKKYPHLTFENGIWKGAVKSYPDDYHQIGARLFECLKQSPDFVGQIDSLTAQEDTFQMMMDRSVRCALWLRKQKIGPEDVVSLSTHNHLNTAIPFLACLYIGVPINTFWIDAVDDDSVAHFINSVEPKIIFANEKTANYILKYNGSNNNNIRVVVFGNTSGVESFDEILRAQSSTEVANFTCEKISAPEKTALLLFTSGSTGHPKALAISYRQLAYNCIWLQHEEIHNSIAMWSAKIGWATAILATVAAIMGPSTNVIQNDVDKWDFCKIIEKYKVEWMNLGVRHVNIVSETSNVKNFDFSSVKMIRFAGAVVGRETEKNLREVFPSAWISQSYGQTEFGGITVAMRDGKLGSCGIPMENIEIKVISADGSTITTPNVVGEFCLKSPDVKVEYYRNLEATKVAVDSNGWYHTGDVGYFDEDGEIFFVERMKEFIRFRAGDIPPRAIEECISKHSGVADVAVVAKTHIDDVEQPIAFVVKKPDAQITKEEILELVEKNLPERMKLRGGVVFVKEIPYNTSGKIWRVKLRALAEKL